MNRSTSPSSPRSSAARDASSAVAGRAPAGLSRRSALGLGLAACGTLALPAAGAFAEGTLPGRLPSVRPAPLGVEAGGRAVVLGRRVTVLVGKDTDPAARAALRELLESVGCTVTESVAGAADAMDTTDATDAAAGAAGRVHLGTPEDNPTIAPTLEALGVDGPDGLAADGYVLAAGRDDAPVAVLAGRDARGTFYAVQTLRQLLDGTTTVPAVRLRDEPLMEIRGAIEGFYGIPWSHRSRLDHFAFYGRHKLNTYIYTPKDDLLLRSRWRELYEGDQLAQLTELVETAVAHHVDFTYALSPGNDIVYCSDEDFEATVTKFEQLRELGVTSFYIALDDIPWELGEEDAAQFGSLPEAQVHYLNRIQEEYVRAHDLVPLQTVPTGYTGSGPTEYKTAFGTGADPEIRIQWTGEGVFSPSITEASVVAAVESYHTDHLYIWDNFPVNDGRRDRLFLTPLEGRAPTLHQHLAGFTVNPMIQPYASLISLANYADYCWNPPGYDAATSWEAAVDELAGPESSIREDLRVFTDLNQNWPYRDGSPTAPALSADIEEFWSAHEAGDADETALAGRLTTITELESRLGEMASTGFYEDTLPWIVAAGHWAGALLAQIEMLRAITENRLEDASAAATRATERLVEAGRATVPDQREDGVHREDQIVPSVGDGVFHAFVPRAWEELRAVLPDHPSLPFLGLPGTATTTLATYQDHTIERIVDHDVETMFWSSSAPEVGDVVQVELEESHPIRFVRVQMATSDQTAGDQIYEGALELSADGESWTGIGATDGTPVAEATLDEPVDARFCRLRVTAENPGGQWVQIREFGMGEDPPAT
ncbi:beta-N-acetylglucosaminidase domain-containing protein [Brachybacterium sp. AOP43-C2-M15]|uniref:beta-N-acetylglucosaminidase domain-containing protein n=1 Tax=Brachybacterium sp. AOP43-C2-M15 TaxID=3457661 RepID=UPI004033421C